MPDIEKSVRDPIYGFIGLTRKEIEIINTPAFQRLRRIKQLGNTHLVYPSANHTRFEHTLGVLHIANRMAHNLNLGADEIEIIRFAALIHDIGHGPLSHIFEEVLKIYNGKKVSHEEIVLKILNEDPDLDKVLGTKKSDVIELLDGKGKPSSVNREIITSNLDADRMDYLLRDSYHIGVAYGTFDLERILHTLVRVDEREESYIAVKEKGKEAVEGIRLARYLMHAQVYSHHIRNISDNMFIRALELSLWDKVIDRDFLNVKDKDFLTNYLWLDDDRILDIILGRKNEGPTVPARKMAGDLQNRRLMKICFKNHNDFSPMSRLKIESLEDPAKRKAFEKRLAETCGCDPDEVMAGLKIVDTTTAKQGKTPILIKLEKGEVKQMDDISPIKFGDAVRSLYIVCPESAENCFNNLTIDQVSRLL